MKGFSVKFTGCIYFHGKQDVIVKGFNAECKKFTNLINVLIPQSFLNWKLHDEDRYTDQTLN